MSVRILQGDCLLVLPTLEADSIDAAVTDPPYHLTSIVKRFGGANAAPAKGNDAFVRASRGFMGKTWDGGDIALRPETWAAVWRVLKPGAYCLAFGGTRTFHRMACAIEDAGFEIRDTIAWMYGSGFPKSHNVATGISKIRLREPEEFDLGLSEEEARFCNWMRDESGLTVGDLRRLLGTTRFITGRVEITNTDTADAPRFARRSMVPTFDAWGKICSALAFLPPDWVSALVKDAPSNNPDAVIDWTKGRNLGTSGDNEWSGWGTALKPAMELICVARKPLGERTVAANVLRHGTGGINVDACRVDGAPEATRFDPAKHNHDGWRMTATGAETAAKAAGRPLRISHSDPGNGIYGEGIHGSEAAGTTTLGRWPANVCHDGSDEVLAAFPDAPGQLAFVSEKHGSRDSVNCYGDYGARPDTPPRIETDKSAARFFYTAKADSSDRAGSRHPTVKPTDLMRWLVKLVTPPGGTVLDPFCGTGSTLVAADQQQFNAIGIEQDATYAADARRKFERDAGLFAEIL